MNKNRVVIIILSVVIVILLSLVILMGIGVIKFKSDDNIVVSQKVSVDKTDILEYYKNMILDLDDDSHQYAIVDINNDNIPELLIYVTGTIGNEIVATTGVFTYDENVGDDDNNYIVSTGILGGRIDANTAFYKMNDGTLLSVFGHMGYEIVSSFKLENDWLVRTSITYSETDDYKTGDEIITFNPCSDTSLIDDYK